MNTGHSPSTSLRHRPEARPGLLITIALVLIGGATGVLTGGPVGVVVIGLVGLAWGILLTLATIWLGRPQPRRRAGAIAILLVCFLLIALQAGSLPDDRTFGALIFAVIMTAGVSLTIAGTRLCRVQPSRQAWARAVMFFTVLFLGSVTGSGLAGHLIIATSLDATPPEVFTALVRGTLGDAEALPYYMLNTPVEWLLLPLAVLMTWPVAGQRRLMVWALVVFTAMRMWTYLYFVPRIVEWEQGAAPLTPGQLDQAMLWADLTWIRWAIDVVTLMLVLLAVFTRVDAPSPQPADAQPAR